MLCKHNWACPKYIIYSLHMHATIVCGHTLAVGAWRKSVRVSVVTNTQMRTVTVCCISPHIYLAPPHRVCWGPFHPTLLSASSCHQWNVPPTPQQLLHLLKPDCCRPYPCPNCSQGWIHPEKCKQNEGHFYNLGVIDSLMKPEEVGTHMDAH